MARSACALLALLLSGCEDPAAALGPTRADARARASDLLGALAARFGPVEREPAYDALRPKLVRNALTPSRIVDDPHAWTAWEGARRSVEFRGTPDASGYRIGLRAEAPSPVSAGEYRGILTLRSEGRGSYEWVVRDELAIGELLPDDAGRALEALFRAAEGEAAAAQGAPVDLRPHVVRALPLAADAFGRLFALQALRATREPDGATSLELRVAMEPARIEPTAPRYARFLRKYVMPIELRTEAKGFWTIEAAQGRATLRLRLRDGRLAPLGGGAQAMADTVEVSLDYSTPAGPFRVGVRRLQADVSLFGSSKRKSFTAVFVREPEWRLPFLLRPFLSGSLRRPFEGEGSLLEFAIGETDGVTCLTRRYRLAVKESWIVRWIGGLTAAAVNDFRRNAEAESDRFTAEGLSALRKDVEALLRGKG